MVIVVVDLLCPDSPGSHAESSLVQPLWSAEPSSLSVGSREKKAEKPRLHQVGVLWALDISGIWRHKISLQDGDIITRQTGIAWTRAVGSPRPRSSVKKLVNQQTDPDGQTFRQETHTVWEQGINLGAWSSPSYPPNTTQHMYVYIALLMFKCHTNVETHC